MKHYAGLDVSLSETSICVVDEKRKIVKEGRVGSEPETIAAWLTQTGLTFERVGIEAGSLAPAMHDGLAAAGLPVVCLDARTTPVKTDRIDARNIAWALQAGWYRVVHVKSRAIHKLWALLRSREMLIKSGLIMHRVWRHLHAAGCAGIIAITNLLRSLSKNRECSFPVRLPPAKSRGCSMHALDNL